jgi:hypothetical protein
MFSICVPLSAKPDEAYRYASQQLASACSSLPQSRKHYFYLTEPPLLDSAFIAAAYSAVNFNNLT